MAIARYSFELRCLEPGREGLSAWLELDVEADQQEWVDFSRLGAVLFQSDAAGEGTEIKGVAVQPMALGAGEDGPDA